MRIGRIFVTYLSFAFIILVTYTAIFQPDTLRAIGCELHHGSGADYQACVTLHP